AGTTAIRRAKASSLIIILPGLRCLLCSCVILCRRRSGGANLAPERGEELPNQMLRHALEDPLADAGHQAADFPLAGVLHNGAGLACRQRKCRMTVPVPERAGADKPDAAPGGYGLVGEADVALESAADRGNLQIEEKTKAVLPVGDHVPASRDAFF